MQLEMEKVVCKTLGGKNGSSEWRCGRFLAEMDSEKACLDGKSEMDRENKTLRIFPLSFQVLSPAQTNLARRMNSGRFITLFRRNQGLMGSLNFLEKSQDPFFEAGLMVLACLGKSEIFGIS